MATNEAPPRTGSDPEQLADFSFYAGIGGVILSLATCLPLVNLCTCFLAPLAGIAAVAMSLIARNQLGTEAIGRAADRARYGLYLGIATLMIYVAIPIIALSFGLGVGFLDTLQNF